MPLCSTARDSGTRPRYPSDGHRAPVGQGVEQGRRWLPSPGNTASCSKAVMTIDGFGALGRTAMSRRQQSTGEQGRGGVMAGALTRYGWCGRGTTRRG